MMKGFRDFVLRGNVVDLAIAVAIGAAFTAVVNSLVADVINPLIAAIFHKPDFSNLVLHVHSGAIKYGAFLNAIIAFLIIAFVIYFFIVLPLNKLLAKFNRGTIATPPAMKKCPQCLSDIPAAAQRCSHCTQPVA
jgi:large conductance mechanosensitive channel